MTDYDFKQLSSYEFEKLSQDLLQKELGLTLEGFTVGRDNGIDLRYCSPVGGKVVIQCKHYSESGFPQLLSHLKNEAQKVRTLNPDRYILVTSVGLTPNNKDQILQIFAPFCSQPSDILGKDDLNNFLRKYPDVEENNIKLWLTSKAVLDRALNNAIVNASEIEFERILEKVKYYVYNESFIDAKSILEKEHVCIIAGIPGIGKTTLAEMLILDHIAEGYQVIKIFENVKEAYQLLIKEKKQVIYYDDFLGQTSLEVKLGKNEEDSLLRLLEAVKRYPNTRVILTTREYILNQAKFHYEKLKDIDVIFTKYVIDLTNYTRLNRAKILYNHLYFSSLQLRDKLSLLTDNNFLRIVDHPNYSPRIIEFMTNDHFRSQVEDYFSTFLYNLNNPRRIWEHAFENQLSLTSRKILIVLYSLPQQVFFSDLNTAYRSFVENGEINRTSSEYIEFNKAIKELDGTFIKTSKIGNELLVEFNNPSIQDFLETHVIHNSEVILALITSASFFEQLISLSKRAWVLNGSSLRRSINTGDFIIKNYWGQFMNKARYLFKSPSCSIRSLKTSNGNILYERVSVGLNSRTVFLASLINDLNLLEMKEQLLTFISEMIVETINEGVNYDIEDLLGLLRKIKATNLPANTIKDDFFETLKVYIVENITTIEEIDSFIDCVDEFPEVFSPVDRENIMDFFIGSYKSDIKYLIDNEQDIFFLNDYCQRFDRICFNGKLDLIINDELAALHTKIAALEEAEIDKPDILAKQEKHETVDDDTEIISMFSSLEETINNTEAKFPQ